MIVKDDDKVVYCNKGQILQIIPWGRGLRIHDSFFEIKNDWALTEKCKAADNFKIVYKNNSAEIKNGGIKAILTDNGRLTFYNLYGKKLLQEFWRTRESKKEFINDQEYIDLMTNSYSSALKIKGREFIPNHMGDYEVHARFEPNKDEKLFGMGQYQQKQLNLKGCKLELAQRNSQASVPFTLSNKGYGFLWNNPGIGNVTFANNMTDWYLRDSDNIDYWICAENSPCGILSDYADVVGHAPKMPKFALGLWQSKLRYRTQEEVLEVARKYFKQHIPLSVIVIDFFHWTEMGEFKFDPKYFPNPKKMVEELNEMNIKLMVSIWPNISLNSKNYKEMKAKGYLVESDRGNGITMKFQGDSTFYDATNPGAREFVWNKVKKNYQENGIELYWLDEAEPEYSQYDFDNHRIYLGRNTKAGNIYPLYYLKGFYDGEKKSGTKTPLNLVRSAWLGSQKYGGIVWSGDTDASFSSFRMQYQAGLNMAIAGIPWWTSDIGGFHGGSKDDPEFKELLIRWFEFATFCPILRMHGDRNPHKVGLSNVGGGKAYTGAPNEIWSFGKNVFNILKHCVQIREALIPYLQKTFNYCSKTGIPIMRPLFLEFPSDKKSWDIDNEHMLGNELLIAPIFRLNERERTIYLPYSTRWKDLETSKIYEGGQTIRRKVPLDSIAIFERVK